MIQKRKGVARSALDEFLNVRNGCLANTQPAGPNSAFLGHIAGEDCLDHILVECLEAQESSHHSADDARVGVRVTAQGDHFSDC